MSSETLINFGGISQSTPGFTAYFSSQPVSVPGQGTGVAVSSVLLNGDTISPISTGMYSGTSSITLSQENWKINGANGIPSFTIQNNTAKPTAVSLGAFPSMISKSAGVTINLGTLSNIIQGSLIISDGSTSLGGTIIIPLSNGNQKIVLTAAQLSGLAIGQSQPGAIGVLLENSAGFNILGKNFKLAKQYQGIKLVSITD